MRTVPVFWPAERTLRELEGMKSTASNKEARGARHAPALAAGLPAGDGALDARSETEGARWFSMERSVPRRSASEAAAAASSAAEAVTSGD